MSTPALAMVVMMALASASASGSVAAHPFHVTIAEVEFNAEAGTLEMAIRIYNPGDLEQALSLREGERVNLEQTEKVDEMILDYLRDCLVITPPDGEAAELAWVGKEVSVKTTWLYVEARLPDGPEGASFTNRLLFEIEADQVNTMVFGRARDRVSLRFTRDDPTHRFQRPGASSSPRKP
ncbi:DUF6702 family protein [Tautonia marina]|uniref:DUF6702 family protein n=1 Tax=Tautonia marina TaxID=2653855 RepID=UPI00126050F6|nr:DUF6702 family protein [Tautonia marina]